MTVLCRTCYLSPHTTQFLWFATGYHFGGMYMHYCTTCYLSAACYTVCHLPLHAACCKFFLGAAYRIAFYWLLHAVQFSICYRSCPVCYLLLHAFQLFYLLPHTVQLLFVAGCCAVAINFVAACHAVAIYCCVLCSSYLLPHAMQLLFAAACSTVCCLLLHAVQFAICCRKPCSCYFLPHAVQLATRCSMLYS